MKRNITFLRNKKNGSIFFVEPVYDDRVKDIRYNVTMLEDRTSLSKNTTTLKFNADYYRNLILNFFQIIS